MLRLTVELRLLVHAVSCDPMNEISAASDDCTSLQVHSLSVSTIHSRMYSLSLASQNTVFSYIYIWHKHTLTAHAYPYTAQNCRLVQKLYSLHYPIPCTMASHTSAPASPVKQICHVKKRSFSCRQRHAAALAE